jgi:hypothetical protein
MDALGRALEPCALRRPCAAGGRDRRLPSPAGYRKRAASASKSAHFSQMGGRARPSPSPPTPTWTANNAPHAHPATGRPAAAGRGPRSLSRRRAPLAARFAAAGSGAAGAAGSADGRRSAANPRSAPTAGACPGGAAQTARHAPARLLVEVDRLKTTRGAAFCATFTSAPTPAGWARAAPRGPPTGAGSAKRRPDAPCAAARSVNHRPNAPCAAARSANRPRPNTPCAAARSPNHRPNTPCAAARSANHRPNTPCAAARSANHRPNAPCAAARRPNRRPNALPAPCGAPRARPAARAHREKARRHGAAPRRGCAQRRLPPGLAAAPCRIIRTFTTPDGAPLEHLNERHGPALAQRALHDLELRLRGVPTLSHLAPEIRAPTLGSGVQSGNNSGSELFIVGPVKTLPDKVIKRGHAYGLATACVTNHVRPTQTLRKARL